MRLTRALSRKATNHVAIGIIVQYQLGYL